MANGTVVVVEDEPDLCTLIQDVLNMAGYRVVPVHDPIALSVTPAAPEADLFLIDVMLPHTSGIELAESLRERGHARTPMLAMSASKLMKTMAAESRLFDDTFDKPFDIGELLDRIQRNISLVHGSAL